MSARDGSLACAWVNPDVHQGGASFPCPSRPDGRHLPQRALAEGVLGRPDEGGRPFYWDGRLIYSFLMPEVAVTGEAHGHAAFIGGGDDIGIALAASWLDGGGGAGVGGGQQAVGERKEGVTGDD